MRALLSGLGVLCTLLAGAAPARAEEPTPEGRAFLEVMVEPEQVVVGQRVRVTLRVLYDKAFFAAHAATLFRQPLDLEIQLTAPWLEALDGAVPVPPLLDLMNRAPRVFWRMALNGSVTSLRATGTELRAGRPHEVLTATQTLIPRRAGTLVLEAPTLRYAYAATIEENLLGERTAKTTRPIAIRGPAKTIDVVEPPREGRPAGFAGAVGRYTVEARVDDPAVTVGESFGITFLISGEGNLGLIAQPLFPDLVGFHVYGAREDPSADPAPGRRVITYDLALTAADIEAVPALPFVFYDPAKGYQTVHSAPLRLAVTPADGGAATRVVGETGDAPVGVCYTPLVAAWILRILLALAVAALVGLGIAALASGALRRGPKVVDPGRDDARDHEQEAAAEAARDAVLAALVGPVDSQMASYVAYLATLLDCGPGAVVGPELAPRIKAAGASEALATRATSAMDALVTERYGGPAVALLDETLIARLYGALALGAEAQGSRKVPERS